MISPHLHAHAYELSRKIHRQLVKSRLRKGLERRSSVADLVSRHVLPSLSIAPALISKSQKLEREMYRNSLENKIQKRPPPDQVRFLGVEWEEQGVCVKRMARRFDALEVGRCGVVARENPTRAAVWRLRKFWEKKSLTG
jgi:hypothetical protein